jgi:hypothetical protein
MESTPRYKLHITREIIKSLSGGDERSEWWDDIKAQLNLIIEGLLLTTISLKDDSVFYRGRPLNGDKYFSCGKQISLRESKDITSYGRCHKPQQQVLYASNNFETVYEELGLNVGDKVQTIEIHKRTDRKVNVVIIGEVDHIRRHGKPMLINEEGVDGIKKYWDSLNEFDRTRYNLVDAFMTNLMRRPVKYQHEYKVTSAFCDIIFEQGVDAIMYPSVGHLGGWNIAIRGDTFKKDFIIKNSEVHKIFDVVGYGIFGRLKVKQSKSLDNKQQINWEKQLSSKPQFKSFDQYLNYCQSLPGRKTLFFNMFKNAKNDFSEDFIQNSLPAINDKCKGMVLKLTFDARRELEPYIDFKFIVNELNKINSDWEVIAVDIGQNLANEEDKNKFLIQMSEKISQSEIEYNMFDKIGEPLVAVSSTSFSTKR